MAVFVQKDIFLKVILAFLETVHCKELGFFLLWSVCQDTSFEISKTVIKHFFSFSP